MLWQNNGVRVLQGGMMDTTKATVIFTVHVVGREYIKKNPYPMLKEGDVPLDTRKAIF